MENVTLLDVYKKILEISYKHNMSHIGSSLSVAPILYQIYKNKKEDEIVILSKGHASAAMYAILLLTGKITEEELDKNFCGHITTKIPGIYWSTGSLGHGLPIAIGCMYANPNRKVHVILSDGELDEGSTLEALFFLLNRPLGVSGMRIRIHLDNNGYSATARTEKYELYKLFDDLRNSQWAKDMDEPIMNLHTNDKRLPGIKNIKSFEGLNSHYHKISQEEYLKCLEYLNEWWASEVKV